MDAPKALRKKRVISRIVMVGWKVDQRRKLTRKRLQAAYKELLKEKPHEAIAATAIAKRAGFNRNTFYQYFANRDDVFLSFHWKLIKTLAGRDLTQDELFNPEPPQH